MKVNKSVKNNVQVIDLSRVAEYYNITENDENWNEYYDFNKDEIIDIYDLVTIAKQVQSEDEDEDGLTNEREKQLGTNPYNSDTDGDGLMDGDEVSLGTNLLNKDTDGDRLPDGFEVHLTHTDPLKKVSQGSDITDDLRDMDKDELINYEEFIVGGNPYNNDSDGDGLLDGQEVGNLTEEIKERMITTENEIALNRYETGSNKYGTSLNNPDSDGDGLWDGTEIKNGYNPLLAVSNNDGIKDGDRVFSHNIDKNKFQMFSKELDGFVPSIDIVGKGDYDCNLSFNKCRSENISFIPEVNYRVGGAFEIKSFKDMGFEKLNIKFDIDPKLVEDNGGINNLQIVCFDTLGERMDSILLDTKANGEQQLDAEIYGDSTIFHKSNSYEDTMKFYIINKQKYYDYYIKDVNQFNEGSKDKKKNDIVILLDTTKSMEIGFKNVRSDMEKFIKNVYEKGDNRVALLEYKDINYRAFSFDCHYNRGWLKDYNDYINKINFLYSTNGAAFEGGGDWDWTDYQESAIDGLYHVYKYYEDNKSEIPFRADAQKHVVIISDNGFSIGTDNDPLFDQKDILSLYKPAGIKISVVAPEVTSSMQGSFKALEQYKPLVDETQGTAIKFYKDGIDKDLSEALLSDKRECKYKVRLVDGRVVTLNANPNLGDKDVDTDNDGIPDLQELGEKRILSIMGQNIEVWDFNTDPTMGINFKSKTNKQYKIDENSIPPEKRKTINIEKLLQITNEISSFYSYWESERISMYSASKGTMAYLQSKAYSENEWNILTDGSATFVSLIAILKPEWEEYRNIDLEHNGEIIDIPHLMVNLNVLSSKISKLISIKITPHIAGFVGDLQQSVGEAVFFSNAKAKREFNEDVIRSVGVDNFTIPNGSSINSYFSRSDFVTDLDAVNLQDLFEKSKDINKVLKEYYCNGKDKNRNTLFIANIGGKDRLKNIIINNIPRDEDFNYDTVNEFENAFFPAKELRYKYIGIFKTKGQIKSIDDRNFEKGMKAVSQYYSSKDIADLFIEKIEKFS